MMETGSIIGAVIGGTVTVLGAPYAWTWLVARRREMRATAVVQHDASVASSIAALSAWQHLAERERERREALESRLIILETQLVEERRLHVEERGARLRAEQRVQDLERRQAAHEAQTRVVIEGMRERIVTLESALRETSRLQSAELQHAIALALGRRDVGPDYQLPADDKGK